MTDLLHIRVDFSNLDEDGWVYARLDRASRTALEGEVVLALDAAGNECLGKIDRIQDEVAYLSLDWSTWIDEDERTGATLLDLLELPTHVQGNGNTQAESESAPPVFSFH